ncbi:basic region leucine zipper domain-containing protein [Pochonia chlamydosporia 170]|uniref:Basic region leucine zipper domain-containing protein n=1 Tax=Pochonia chlamydosporia 170 TaxID=1380566 RepID=A0A179F1D4_METCM|nr:basic region leucine zipper domain-containing protein [Pochonia chlamydosporia 170]OAQ59275.1 basic region leucine zipper domain-containing protein [Pochonia chlamydosporia 170]
MSEYGVYVDSNWDQDHEIAPSTPGFSDDLVQFDFQPQLSFFVTLTPELVDTPECLPEHNYNIESLILERTENDVPEDLFCSPHSEQGDRLASTAVEVYGHETPSPGTLSTSPESINSSNVHTRTTDDYTHKPIREQGAKKQKRQSKRSKRTSVDAGVGIERNRIAALKSRIKNKEWEQNLASTMRDLERKHSMLIKEHSKLLQDALELKNIVIYHARCHDDRIDAWISSAAKAFVHGQTQAA